MKTGVLNMLEEGKETDFPKLETITTVINLGTGLDL
jgi:hypothetical protein